MASRYVLPIRRAEALTALNKAGNTLAKRFNVDPPDLTPNKDPELDRIVQIENMAAFLDGLAKATKPEKVEGQAEAEEAESSQEEVVAPQEDEATAESLAPPPPQDLESQENKPVEVPASPVTEVEPVAPQPAPVKSTKTSGTQAKGVSASKGASKGKASKARR